MAQTTAAQYAAIQAAYDHFNMALWGGALPQCLITFQRKAKTLGYFRGGGFVSRTGGGTTDEIALNPDGFTGQSDLEILGTLVHEMAHLWQHRVSGRPCRPAYHDRVWSAEMQRVGLMPSDTGQPGGKTTGQRMNHYTIGGGAFEAAAVLFLAPRPAFIWQSAGGGRSGTPPSKVKYACPACGNAVWGKPGMAIVCGHGAAHPSVTAHQNMAIHAKIGGQIVMMV